MNNPLALWPRSVGRVCSSCRVRLLLPLLQHRAASYWKKSNSTHIRQARQEEAKSLTHAQLQKNAEYKEVLRRYLLAGFANGEFSADTESFMRLLNWMMEMGDKNSHEKFTTMCEGRFPMTTSIIFLTLNRTLSLHRTRHGVCSCPVAS
jgi:hypothetical protein